MMNSFLIYKIQIVTIVIYFCLAFYILINSTDIKRERFHKSFVYFGIFCLFYAMGRCAEQFLLYSHSFIYDQLDLYLTCIHSLSLVSLLFGIRTLRETKEMASSNRTMINVVVTVVVIFALFLYVKNQLVEHIATYFVFTLYALFIWKEIENRHQGKQPQSVRLLLPISMLIVSVTLLFTVDNLTSSLSSLIASIALFFSLARHLEQAKSEWEKKRQQEDLRHLHDQHLTDLGKWCAALAHELKTPLSSAILLSQVLERTNLSSDSNDKNFSLLKQSLEKASATCQGILSYARTLDTVKTRVNVDVSLQEVLALFSFRLKEFDVSTSVQDGLTLYADKTLIASVWSNLISNAIDANLGNETRKIIICGYQKEGCAHITITDQGKGISEDIKSRVQDPFFTTKYASGGTGLGINVVMSILKSHQGSLEYENQLAGTCAHVILPGVVS
ncbi:sensor histidine kinase [Vibrio viridaestus]|uniref:histidine kinase n=1 Tax=Vibrio viridaestus TaxID=2487322 RepID=A0A3N9TDB3_9VIBR|nr:HAMP domain-containing sensor histidine kinase [Vibrio viridaestus]RQW62039.1 sensor histidine kinase [Vibrio viridaestus]